MQGAVIHDLADFAGSVNGPRLMISETKTNAALSLIKIMVFKGKQMLELSEYLNYLK